ELHVANPTNDVLSSLSKMIQSSPHVLSLLYCHDKVASKEYDEPQLNDTTYSDGVYYNDDDDDKTMEETMKVVRLVKSDEPLGATIAGDEKGNIVVARILKGGAADRSGLIHVNDILVEVNDVAAQGKKPEELIQLLAGLSGPLTFKLIPGEAVVEPRTEELYLRSRYKYHPKSDPLIPCQEAGLDFNPGDVLRVVSKDDASWWQAIKLYNDIFYKVSEKPSNHTYTRTMGNTQPPSTGSVIRASFRRKRNSPRPDKHQLTPVKSQAPKLEPPTFPPYEVVSQFIPHQNGVGNTHSPTYRPIVLVGPQGVGRNELKDRLIDSNPAHYGVPVPHTSRSKQIGEMDGKDYHFVTREYMESGIRDNLFLEYGEYKGNLYGTSLSAVHTVIQNHQVCVLTPYPQALSVLRCKEMKPYIVFIQPPTLDQLDTMGIPGDVAPSVRPKLTIERDRTQDELSNLVNRGERMEAAYGRLFDARIVNDNVDAAFAQLKEISFFLENDLQWLPSEWMD
uniref:MAGUK p55 subfamily member 7 n=1 Tax=Ciona savignyi TaxID=51511 RepID=H2YGE1_CIOSA